MRPGQRSLGLFRIQPDDQFPAMEAATHVAVQQERNAAEHLLLRDRLASREKLSHPFRLEYWPHADQSGVANRFCRIVAEFVAREESTPRESKP